MKLMDLVMLLRNQHPVIGQVIGFTNKRVRVAVRHDTGYISVLRAKHNVTLAKKVRGLA